MPEKQRYDPDFRAGAVGIVRETGKTIAQVARDLGINSGTLANWVAKDRIARGERLDPAKVDPDRLRQLEAEVAELRMERDVLKRSVVLWVLSQTRDKTHYAERRIMPSRMVNAWRDRGFASGDSA
jgi:transposase